MNPFLSYRVINADGIIQANIRPNRIQEDLHSLLDALNPLLYISKSEAPEGSSLNSKIVAKLDAKNEILDLLNFFGYIRNNTGDYIYKPPKSDYEEDHRENGVKEFIKFYGDLKKAKVENLAGFQQFVQASNRRSSSDYHDESDDDEQIPIRSTISTRRSNFEQSPIPNQNKINAANEQTLKTIELFKKTLVTQYDIPPAHGFIRRKMAIQTFKQKNSNSTGVSDDIIGQAIDQKIRLLKEKDRQTNVSKTDEIYIECLIRSDFDENEALKILRHGRPNLTTPIQPLVSNISKTTTITKSVEPLKQHCNLLNRYNHENNTAQEVSHGDNEWKVAKHLIPAIIQFRQQHTNQIVHEHVLSKMYRLLYSELSHTMDRQLPVKIETFASILCELPFESIENLDMAAIKDILRSCNDAGFHDDFRTNAMNALSITCPICSNSYPRSQIETMFLCNHTCCTGCIKDYYRNNIKTIRDSQSLNRLTCFQEAHEIIPETKMNFFQYLESKLNQWFSNEPDICQKYQENIFNATRDNTQIRKCGSSTCVSYFHIGGNNEITRILCPDCRFAQCGRCSRKWYAEHIEIDCDEYEDWLADNDEDDPDVQVLRYLNTTGIVCPQCQAIYQYQPGGCEHFVCGICQTDFCRMCSSLFCVPSKDTICSQENCLQKNMLHAHCSLNCFRETRIAQIDDIIRVLNQNNVDETEELDDCPIATSEKCPVEGCIKPASILCGNRFCEMCYKQFLCSLIWRNQIEPWDMYEDNNLQQMLRKASVAIPADATRQKLIELSQQNLNRFLGKPKKISRPKFE